MDGHFTQHLCVLYELHRPGTFRPKEGHEIGLEWAHLFHAKCGQWVQFGHIGFTVCEKRLFKGVQFEREKCFVDYCGRLSAVRACVAISLSSEELPCA